MEMRPLTDGEKALARSIFGAALDLDPIRIKRGKWIFFQPRAVLMTPMGHIHVHPKSDFWSEDYSHTNVEAQGIFLHELVHIWQTQRGIFLPLKRHPFCTYSYSLKPGWTLDRYGLEQQAEIVRHAFLLRTGHSFPGAPDIAQYESILRIFGGHAG